MRFRIQTVRTGSYRLYLHIPYTFQVDAALVRDTITLMSNALSERKLYRRISTPPISCEQMSYVVGQDMPQYWREGRELLKNIDTVQNIRRFSSMFQDFQSSFSFLLLSLIEQTNIWHYWPTSI